MTKSDLNPEVVDALAVVILMDSEVIRSEEDFENMREEWREGARRVARKYIRTIDEVRNADDADTS